MKPEYSNDSHSVYQAFLVQGILTHVKDPFSMPDSIWDIIVKFYNCDLSFVDKELADSYHARGPNPRLPSCMLRCYLLSLKLKIPSITAWVSALHSSPLYAIISGFEPDDIPGIGTFYDFFGRMWNSDNPNISATKEKYKKPKTPKGRRKGDKTPNINKTASARLISLLERLELKDSSTSPVDPLFRLFKHFLQTSVRMDLINPNKLALAGDGTPVRTSARMRYKKICDCYKKKGILHCNCKRSFSQPDCDIGWDSSRDCYFHGYHLYMFVDADSDNDLPIFPMLEKASRHDMLSFLHSLFTMQSWMPEISIDKLILDSAHDSDAVYRFCKRKDITAIIDLNGRHEGQKIYQGTFTINEKGRPVCVKTGKPFISDGKESSRNRQKWRCPMSGKNGCTCETPCSASPYGRTVHTSTEDNPRLFCEPRRDSKEWKLEYNKRTSVERSNKREKEDYKLEDGRHRSSKMWYCRLFCIMMLQHLDAWEFPSTESFKCLLANPPA